MVADLVEVYLAHGRSVRGLAENSVRAYRGDLADFRRFAARCGGDLVLAGETYLDHLQVERALGWRTVRRRIVAVRSFLCWLATYDTTIETHLPDVPRTRGGSRQLPRTIKAETLRQLLGSSSGARLPGDILLALRLLLATGLRISELCAVRTQDFNAGSGALRILGKGAKERVVYVANAGLRQDLAARAAAPLQSASGRSWLFRNGRGTQLKPQTVRGHLKALLAHLAIDDHVTPHMFRHTSATLHLEHGVDIRFVQRMLGHSSIATTQIYTHVSDNALREAMLRGDPLAGF